MSGICVGKHLIIDYCNCDDTAFTGVGIIRSLIHDIATSIGVAILKEDYHEFTPFGVTGFAIVSASHISIHTWPEYGYLGIDIFSCRDIKLEVVFGILSERLPGGKLDYRYLDRVSNTPCSDK